MFSGFLHYLVIISLEMSDEPYLILFLAEWPCPMIPPAWVLVVVTFTETWQFRMLFSVPKAEPTSPAECMPPRTEPVTWRFLMVAP